MKDVADCHLPTMPARLSLIPLLLVAAAASAAETQWQAPKILPPKGEPAQTAPAPERAASKPQQATAAKPAASAAVAAVGASSTPPAKPVAKPASAPELAAKIKEKLEEQAKAPPPRPLPQKGHASSSFMTQAELQARMKAAAASREPALPARQPAPRTSKLALATESLAPPPARPRATRAQTAAAVHAAHPAHWSYEGMEGPEHWARLSPDWARCATGHRQSPIDIRDGIKLELEEPLVEYQSSRFSVLDNGHTIQVDVQSPNFISLTGRRYQLQQFHFHRPAEERIEGRGFDMVVHLVHKDAEGRLMVVAVMIEAGSPHAGVQAVWNNLPLEKNETVTPAILLDLVKLLPMDRRYYTYMGSLTTPPCSEGVLWVVMKQPIQLSEQQIRIFARLYPLNARPLQAMGDRLIKESN